MITEESIHFLKNTLPFQFLDESVIRKIAGNLSLEFSPKQTFILKQGGPPSNALRIIKKGGVKVYLSNHEEIVLDYKSEGDSIGYLSLVSGDKSRINVLAVEDTLCYLVPKEIILHIINKEPLFNEYFMKSFLGNYLEKTYTEMQKKNKLFKEGEKLLYTTPVKDIISKGATTTPEGTTIKEAAAIMSDHRISSIIIIDKQGTPVGIVTDRDLRDKVVAKGLDSAMPINTIMSKELVTIDSESTCFDVLSTMIKRNIHHMVIVKGRDLAGVVTNHDFMMLQGTSPLSILKNIDRIQNTDELRTVSDKINQTITILLKEGVKAGYILKIITELHDRLIRKIIDFTIKEKGHSHCPFAFFAYGAEGRREETFKTVFHFAIVYNMDRSDCRKQEMDGFCRDLVDSLQETFRKLAFPPFDLHPLGNDVPIYGDVTEWENNILSALVSEEKGQNVIARKMLDLRTIYGVPSIVETLRDRLYHKINKSEKHIAALSSHASNQTSPIGFFKKFVVDEHGKQEEEFDIKENAVSHIVDDLRLLSILHHVNETSTIARTGMLSKKDIIPKDLKNDIDASFDFLLHLLMQSQLMKKELGHNIDNVIETGKLSMLEKKSLKDIFQIIPVLQEITKNSVKNQEAAVQ